MKQELLERGRQLLLADAANPQGIKFDLGMWAAPDPDGVAMTAQPSAERPAFYDTNRANWRWQQGAKVPVSCHTQGCAFGLFAISGAFKQEGLGYHITATGNIVITLDHGEPPDQQPTFFAAATELFGITDDDAHYLFNPQYYASLPQGADGEREVADRIERFMVGVIDEEWHPKHLREEQETDDD